jgi:ABC-type glycerol-3-phosphate transport system permease component
MRGMTGQFLSLQQLNAKIAEIESKVNSRLDEFKPVLSNLENIWRTLINSLLVAALVAIFATVFGQALGPAITYLRQSIHTSTPTKTPADSGFGIAPPAAPAPPSSAAHTNP